MWKVRDMGRHLVVEINIGLHLLRNLVDVVQDPIYLLLSLHLLPFEPLEDLVAPSELLL